MSSLKPPRHYRLARRMDAQQRAYDDVAARRYQHFRRRWITQADLNDLDKVLAADKQLWVIP